MKKAELSKEVNKLAAEYLGYPSETQLFFLRNMKKGFLEEMLLAYQKMIELHRESENIINKYTFEQRNLFSFNDNMPDDLKHAYAISKEANDLWLLKKF